MIKLIESLAGNPKQGKALETNFYKIRLSIASKGSGKSVGAGINTYIKISEISIFLTSIYDKSENSNISEKELEQIFKLIP